ncbi:hypothetical protein AVEN_15961-1, partial [Araneus ventricosus]
MVAIVVHPSGPWMQMVWEKSPRLTPEPERLVTSALGPRASWHRPCLGHSGITSGFIGNRLPAPRPHPFSLFPSRGPLTPSPDAADYPSEDAPVGLPWKRLPPVGPPALSVMDCVELESGEN